MRIYLVRHPRPAVAEGVCYGRTDVDLAEDAGVVAQRLRPHLPVDAPVFSSPLRRCRQLAERLSPTHSVDPRLVEIDFGAWEMQRWDDIGLAALEGWATNPLHHVPPGGESPAQLLQRVGEFHAALQVQNFTEVVLVAHAGVMKALCGLLENLPAEEWIRLSFDFGSVTLIERGRRVWHNVGHG